MKIDDALIPCTPELNLLKNYLWAEAARRRLSPEAREAKEEFALEAKEESTWMLRGKWTHDAERV